MKPLRILIPILGLLVCDVGAQTNDASTNSPASLRARQFRNATNFLRRIPGGPTASLATNAVAMNIPAAGGAETNAVRPAVAVETPVVGPPVTAVPPPNVVDAAATAPAVPGGQVPTRTQLPIPTLPIPGAPGAAVPSIVAAPTNAPPQDVSSALLLKNAPLETVFEMYQEFSGRTVLRPVTLPAQNITIFAASSLTPQEAIQALDSVLALNGIVMLNLGEKFVKAVPATQADKEGGIIDTNKPASLPDTEQFLTKVVTLKTAKPSEVAQVITGFSKTPSAVTPIDSNMTIVLRDYSSNIKRMMELIEKIDVLPEKDFKLEVIPIRYGKVGDIYATMSALISGGGGSGGSGFTGTGVGGRSTGFGAGGFGGSMMMNRGRMGGGYGSQYGGYGGGSAYGGYGGGSYGGGYNRGYGGGYSGGSIYPQQVAQPSAAGAQSSFQNRLNQIVNRATKPEEQQVLENANIVPDERSNKLLIFANKRDMEMITNIVAKVDVLLAQVLIEAVILEVNLDDSVNYGVSAAQREKKFGSNFTGAGASKNTVAGNPGFFGLTNFPAGAPEGFSYFGKIGSSFDVAIQAIATSGKADVISRPRIQTSHAIPGNIFVGETRPYVTGFNDYSFGTSLSTRSQVQEKTIGLTLSVTPFITPDGLVVMELQQQFDRFRDNIIVEGNPYPLVDSRMADSTLTVRNGDLIMLGGLIRDSRNNSKSGVPILKDIPGLGALFRSTTRSAQRTELIILMKATVLESPEAASFLAERERATLPGVREAEMDQKEMDEKRDKKLNSKEKSRRKAF